MKNRLIKALSVLAIIGATSQTQAYSYIFSNHTSKEIGVGLRYYGFGEPRYYRWIPSHQARQFTPGQKTRSTTEKEVEYRKIGFVGKTLWYVINPTQAQKEDPKAIAWREFEITWVPTEAYKIAIELCEAISAATIEAAKLALEAAMAAATDGASVAVQGAAKTAQDAITALGKGAGAASAPASTPKTETAATNTGSNNQAILKAVQNGIVSDALTKLISAVGKAAGRSLMTDRHIDIIEDKEGIKFISLM